MNIFNFFSVVVQGENGWGEESFEVEAILDRTVSEVICFTVYILVILPVLNH